LVPTGLVGERLAFRGGLPRPGARLPRPRTLGPLDAVLSCSRVFCPAAPGRLWRAPALPPGLAVGWPLCRPWWRWGAGPGAARVAEMPGARARFGR